MAATGDAELTERTFYFESEMKINRLMGFLLTRRRSSPIIGESRNWVRVRTYNERSSKPPRSFMRIKKDGMVSAPCGCPLIPGLTVSSFCDRE